MKYLEIAKTTFKAQLAWRFDIALNMVFTVSKILLAYVLWSAIFGSREVIAGFTFSSMLTYYIVSSFLSQLDMSASAGSEIADRIRNGTLSGKMVLPVDLFGLFAAQTAGASAFYLSFNLVAAAAWVFLFRIDFALTGTVALIVGALMILALGLVFMVQLNSLIGILAFKFLDIWMFQMIKDNLLAFATGTLVPLALLPEIAQQIMRCLPFYYVTYLPSMLLMGRNGNEVWLGLGTLAVWNVLLFFGNRHTYRRLRVMYDGVGI